MALGVRVWSLGRGFDGRGARVGRHPGLRTSGAAQVPGRSVQAPTELMPSPHPSAPLAPLRSRTSPAAAARRWQSSTSTCAASWRASTRASGRRVRLCARVSVSACASVRVCVRACVPACLPACARVCVCSSAAAAAWGRGAPLSARNPEHLTLNHPPKAMSPCAPSSAACRCPSPPTPPPTDVVSPGPHTPTPSPRPPRLRPRVLPGAPRAPPRAHRLPQRGGRRRRHRHARRHEPGALRVRGVQVGRK